MIILCQHADESDVRIIWQESESRYHKNALTINYNFPWNKEKTSKSSKKYKLQKGVNGIHRTEKYKILN